MGVALGNLRGTCMKVLQLVNLLLLLLLLPMLGFLKATLPTDDKWQWPIAVFVSVAGMIALAVVLIDAIRGPQASVRKIALKKYQQLANRLPALIAFDCVLLLANMALADQALDFNDIEVIASSDVRVGTESTAGAKDSLAHLKANTPTKIRLRVGPRYLVFYRDGGADSGAPIEEPLFSERIDVPRRWHPMERLVLPLTPIYELLR